MSVQTRERILKAAEREFSERGFHGTQISHIVKSAGVARGTFYIYFRSKEEVFEELLKRVIEDLKECIKPVDLSGNPVRQVEENLQRVIEYALRNEGLAKILLFRSCEPEYGRIVERFFEEITSLVESSLRKGIELGILRPHDTKVVARAIVGGVKEVVKGFLLEGGDPEKAAGELLNFCMGGLWNGEGRS
ncbi:MAG: TetR/AcrR family transcriptional regulator [Aquificae bacterium]|nr:TetR/AcrR family transcriptional regulator [Aquificota bacterium]